ncbi:MAG: hypothetical protein LIP28_06510 [Deltaproteobacteria bacterium]|nr:hypothetical protein [Deltaproteobacteria bacterium]
MRKTFRAALFLLPLFLLVSLLALPTEIHAKGAEPKEKPEKKGTGK